MIRFGNEMAVKISNGAKSFRDKFSFTKNSNSVEVLQNFNLNVPKGSIYSLLGSGCGKTTVISIIAGLCKVDAGKLEVMPSSRTLGYMPQDICLYSEFSIYETLQYFGILFGIVNDKNNERDFLKLRINYLRKLLLLPSEDRIVGTLSGGQKRRLSLDVALVHEPDILLLDEPTSGVDPLVRELIWDHLNDIVKLKGTTILLTTHYVDEAKSSDVVGFMRNGQLIAEDTPSTLFERYGVNSMEAVYLALCQQQNFQNEMHPPLTNKITDGSRSIKKIDVVLRNEYDVCNSLRIIYALVGKNYKCTFRNICMLILITTILALCMLGTCIGIQDEPHNIALGVVNHDIVEFGQTDGDIGCITNDTIIDFCRLEQLSCVFIESLVGNTFKMINFPTVQSATEAVQQGNVYGYIYFSKNYTTAALNRVLAVSSSFYDESDDGMVEWNDSKIIARLDQTRSIVYGTIVTALHEAFEKSSKIMMQNCGYDERIAEYPLQYTDPIVGEKDVTFLYFIGASLSIEVIYFFSLITAIRFITEKRDGTLERCKVGGARNWEILMSYAIAQSTVILIQSIFVVVLLHFGFSVINYISKMPLILILFWLQGLSGLAMGLLLAIFCTEEYQAAIATIALVLPNLFVSGLVWPLEALPEFMQKISSYLPMTLSAESMRSLMLRGWNFYHPNVWQGFLITVGYIILWSVLVLILIGKHLHK